MTSERIGRMPAVLVWIIVFKFFKAATLAALGVVLVTVRRSDPIEVLIHLALAVHLPLTSRLFERAMRAVANLTVARETALAVAAFGYSILMGSEGLALRARKSWARWFTIGATCSLVPVELYEIAREPRPGRILVLLANLAVVGYLVMKKELFEHTGRFV
jgi:uncharacterized membrane protein (DUF2068 family)